ncbi:hypothetical protein [Evansella tamaricis]|uniref:Uncharacterized protein n=1 Tax=Evansella tamaricis TaxID=2069301 RepID=A0ABS6JEJ1_9BACI|nr:hypothetical protein [Evansella tamaricis]MBU9711810.1 hypothetical protein [Evansella tamaricis]
MKLVQVLLSQPQSELVNRVKTLGLSCNTHSRQEITEALVKTLLDEVRTIDQWNSLQEKEQQLLLQMSFSSSISFPTDELSTCLKQSYRKELPSLLETLKRKGWIFEDNWNQCIIPLELKEWIGNYFWEQFKENSIIIPFTQDDELVIIDDIFHFMDFVEDNKVRLTKNGTIYRKQLKEILSHLSTEESFPEERWRFGYGRHFYSYPDCFSLLYDFCYGQRWIQEGEELTVTKEWEKGQRLSVKEILDRFLRSYIQLYKRAIPQLPFLVEVIIAVLSDGSAVEKKEIVGKLSPFVDNYYFDQPENIIEDRVIQMLQYLQILSSERIDNCEFLFLHPYKKRKK